MENHCIKCGAGIPIYYTKLLCDECSGAKFKIVSDSNSGPQLVDPMLLCNDGPPNQQGEK